MKKLIFFLFFCFISVYAQDTNSIEIVTTGSGETKEIAVREALRTALEQSYGSFISSKTKINNNSLIDDEIVSITNGNIHKYEVVSEINVGLNYSVTVKSEVSLNQINNFTKQIGESEIKFDGGLFGIKLKLQKMNENAERESLVNLLETLLRLYKKSIDFNIVSRGNPKINNSGKFNIEFTVGSKYNQNMNEFFNHFSKSISNIAMDSKENIGYTDFNKSTYQISVNNESFYFRNKDSYELINKFIEKCTYYFASFYLTDSDNNILYNPLNSKNIAKNLNSFYIPFFFSENKEEVKWSYIGNWINTKATVEQGMNPPYHSDRNLEFSITTNITQGSSKYYTPKAYQSRGTRVYNRKRGTYEYRNKRITMEHSDYLHLKNEFKLYFDSKKYYYRYYREIGTIDRSAFLKWYDGQGTSLGYTRNIKSLQFFINCKYTRPLRLYDLRSNFNGTLYNCYIDDYVVDEINNLKVEPELFTYESTSDIYGKINIISVDMLEKMNLKKGKRKRIMSRINDARVNFRVRTLDGQLNENPSEVFEALIDSLRVSKGNKKASTYVDGMYQPRTFTLEFSEEELSKIQGFKVKNLLLDSSYTPNW